MISEITNGNVLVAIMILPSLSLCEKIKLYQTDGRVTPASKTEFKRSLLDCSISFKVDKDSLSFNYNKENKICELSNNYPEGSTISSSGWDTYAHIVNGGWDNWHSWGSCSVNGKDGTRTRSRPCSDPAPSNGGQTCQGPSNENGPCNDRQHCFLASNNYFGSEDITQPEAAALCQELSARLVIFESQEEIDFLQTQVSEFSHWIGMTCTSNVNCNWVDGRDVNSGFTAWLPGEPKGLNCVWIGWYGNKWDDFYCSDTHKALCEFL